MSTIKGKTGEIACANNFDTDDDLTFETKLSRALMKNISYLYNNKQQTMHCKKLYFAGPWFDERANELYSTCQSIIRYCSSFTRYDAFIPREQINASPLSAFNSNVKQIKDADLVVALISRKDCGTSWEIGMAYALGKRIVLIGYDETSFLSHTNVMLAFTGEKATISELGKILCDDEYEQVEIKNNWRGIE